MGQNSAEVERQVVPGQLLVQMFCLRGSMSIAQMFLNNNGLGPLLERDLANFQSRKRNHMAFQPTLSVMAYARRFHVSMFSTVTEGLHFQNLDQVEPDDNGASVENHITSKRGWVLS
ncbi:hypothetical protein PRK78_002351 [Emydomyces testavorans]|uniref:Uncharacterized protein n=1 Tax=Emydomyces testavorans TaxID=2070801 RepID=A0AAF0IJK5_9EURO|nr:hypothetical protein PRK78_002351 [Emydomyces testavorans]